MLLSLAVLYVYGYRLKQRQADLDELNEHEEGKDAFG